MRRSGAPLCASTLAASVKRCRRPLGGTRGQAKPHGLGIREPLSDPLLVFLASGSKDSHKAGHAVGLLDNPSVSVHAASVGVRAREGLHGRPMGFPERLASPSVATDVGGHP